MDVWTREYDGRVTSLTVDVEVNGAEGSKPKTLTALIDTGCDTTSIYNDVAIDMGLKKVGEKPMKSATGRWVSPLYYVDLTIGGKIKLDGAIAAFPQKQKTADFIIGLDTLSICDFAITNANGRTKVSLAWPTSHDIDFNDNLIQIILKKLKRLH